MPNPCNLTELILVINSVHESIRTKNDLANIVIPIFGNNATQFRKCLQAFCLGNQFVSEGHCTVGIVARNEDNYVVDVVPSNRRPDQLVSHEANCFLTSS